MQWIILVGNENLSLGTIENMKFIGSKKVAQVSKERIVVDYGEDHVFFDYANDIINDYEEDELLLLPFEKPRFIMMTFSSTFILKKILTDNNFPNKLYIDDDQGNILKIEDYIRLLNSGG